MKRGLVVVGFVLCLGMSSMAEAGVGEALKNTWSYLFAPVNCVGNFVKDVGKTALSTLVCVLGNVSRNPVNLQPIIQ